MEQRKGVRAVVADRAGRYWIGVEVVRSDWVAQWYVREVNRFVQLQGLQLQGLTEKTALRRLGEMARALEVAGYAVEWVGSERRSFTYNDGGVRVTVGEGKEP